MALSHADQEQRPLALLGDAWATAVRNERSPDAVRKLSNFVDQYPGHKDAPNAARGCAQCLKHLGRDADSTAMLSDLLNRWPDSSAALAVVRTHCGLSPALIPSAVKHWIMVKANANDLESFDLNTTMLGLIIASEESELIAWSNLSEHLAITDTTGQTTSDTLRQLHTEKRESDAEQLAVKLITSASDRKVAPAAREAACRWAGRTSRWSMLAIASETEDLNTADPTRTLAVERLFAEALTQTGQTQQAHAWWVHLADVRSADDFRILIRCAETETAFGNDADKAEERIAAARKAAGENAASIALTEMLESELAIRRSNFDEARRILEQVVRSPETAAELRGRAQWLIGETWYMQRRHKDAIEAYRKVEAMDTTGTWVAASYLQAGKSFERMGRVKEATLCYGAILSRFADTSYAAPASNRMGGFVIRQKSFTHFFIPTDDPTMNPQHRQPTHGRLLPINGKPNRHQWQLLSRVLPLIVLSIGASWWMIQMRPAMAQFPNQPTTSAPPFQPINQNFNTGTAPSIPASAIPSTEFRPNTACGTHGICRRSRLGATWILRKNIGGWLANAATGDLLLGSNFAIDRKNHCTASSTRHSKTVCASVHGVC